MVANRNGSGAGDLWKLQRVTLDGLEFEYDPTGNGGTAAASTGDARVAIGEVFHGAGRYDGSELAVFVNGVKGGTTVSTTTAAIDQDDHVIGRTAPASAQERWNGLIESALVWMRALSDAEIHEAYIESFQGFPNLLQRVPRRVISVPAAGPAAAEFPFHRYYAGIGV